MKIIKKFLRVYYLFKYVNFSSSSLFKDEEIVVWIYLHNYLKYFYSDNSVTDFGYITALSNLGIKHRIYIGKTIGKYHNRTIFCSYDRKSNVFNFKDYVATFQFLLKQLELQGNKIFPRSHDVKFWENKSYMYNEFEKLGVSEPKTILCKNLIEVQNMDLSFPYLIKEEHSASSAGIYKICSNDDLIKRVDNEYLKRNNTIICQELINMRKDLRVILVNDQIILHYWRINLSNEWKPTATSFGSDVDFKSFPDEWKNYIITTFKKLNLITGAFDITWQNDDLTSIPLFLEISPTYQPNPMIDLKKIGVDYGTFKNKLSLKANYDKEYIKLVNKIQLKVVKAFLNT